MPTVTVTSKKLNETQRANFSLALTNVFTEELGCPSDVVMIRFHGLGEEDMAIGGRLLHQRFDEAAKEVRQIPFEIRVDWYAGRTKMQMDRIAERISNEAFAGLRVNPEAAEIKFHIIHPGNHYEGGKPAGKPLSEAGPA